MDAARCEPSLGIERGLAAHSGRGDRLPIERVGHVAAGKREALRARRRRRLGFVIPAASGERSA